MGSLCKMGLCGSKNQPKEATQGDGQKTLLVTDPASPAGEVRKEEKAEEPQERSSMAVEVAEEILEMAEKVKDAILGSDETATPVEAEAADVAKLKEVESTVAKPT